MARRFGMLYITILLTLMAFANTAFAAEEGQMHEAQLTPGWDIFDQTGWGTVTWRYDPGQSDISGTFELIGALPNHQYTVGVHLFNKDDLTKKPSEANPKVKDFLGKDMGGGCIEREGTSACVDDFDFTTLTTDERGYGKVGFEGFIQRGLTYYAQFTVRIGECPGGGCSAVYRTGDKFAQNFEVINAYASSSKTPVSGSKTSASESNTNLNDNIEPTTAEGWNTRGHDLYKQGKYDEAINAFNQAIDLNPHDANSWYNLGLAYRMKGDIGMARLCQYKALDFGYPDNGLRDALAKEAKSLETGQPMGSSEPIPVTGPEDLAPNPHEG